MLSFVTLFAAISTGLALNIEIDWSASVVQTTTAQRGDKLNFNWSGTKPVGWVATQAEFDSCDATDAYGKTGMTSPSQITVPTDTPDGTVWYFINTRGGKCEEGIKIAVTVTGGEGGTSGQCVAIACRSSNNGANPAKDYECCSIADSYGYKASCAVGFTYYQWDRQSDSVGGWQDESVTCRTDGASSPSPDGSCCVADGQTVPAGAALPSDGEDDADDEDDEDLGDGAAAGLQPGAHALAIAVALVYAAAAH